jgi:hypothetical protein
MTARTLTGMLVALTLAATARAEGVAQSKSLFINCEYALQTREYAPLRAVIPEKLRESSGCLRLTNQEFVLFAQPGFREGPFFYCDLRSPSPTCEQVGFAPYSFDDKQEFTGAKGKKYMLWFTSRISQGYYSDGYGIFSLVPRSMQPRGFDIYALAGGRFFHGEDPSSSDPCRDSSSEVNEITGYQLFGEGTQNVELVFTEKVINCVSKEQTLRERRYRPKNGKFELLP